MRKAYIGLFLALLVTYIVLAFTLPTDPRVLSKHGLTQTEAHLLNLTIVVPIALVYLTALYGFLHVNRYANKVVDTKEGPHFKNVATGLMLLAISLPLGSVLGTLRTYARHELPNMLSSITIIRNYLGLAFILVAIYLIAKGAQGLYDTLKRSKASTKQSVSYYGIVGPVILASCYTWLIVNQGYRTPGDEPYFLPDWAVIATIVIPYVFIWCVGIWAAIHLYRYQKAVKGVIYARAINHLAKGVAFIILISIMLQVILSLAGVLNRLDLTPLLMIVYMLIALYVVGYGLVARGAKQLKQIEEA